MALLALNPRAALEKAFPYPRDRLQERVLQRATQSLMATILCIDAGSHATRACVAGSAPRVVRAASARNDDDDAAAASPRASPSPRRASPSRGLARDWARQEQVWLRALAAVSPPDAMPAAVFVTKPLLAPERTVRARRADVGTPRLGRGSS